MNHSGNWQPAYEAVLMQEGGETRNQRIDAAIHAIDDRLEDALHGRSPLDSTERLAIMDASRTLRFLKEHRQAA
jgi:hypothetical protein